MKKESAKSSIDIKHRCDFKNKKGITLIALVITIIVLLLLGGISISMLSGQDGILSKTAETKSAVRVGEIEEAISLWKMNRELKDNGLGDQEDEESLTDYLERVGVITSEEKQEAIQNGEIIIGNEVVSIDKVAVKSIIINGESKVKPNAEIQLSAEVSPSDATKKDVTWSTSDDSIATVDSTGKVRGIVPGTVTITATADGIQSTKTIKVPEMIKVTYKAGVWTALEWEIEKGSTYEWETNGNEVCDGLKKAASNAINQGLHAVGLSNGYGGVMYGLYYDSSCQNYIEDGAVFSNNITVYMARTIYGNFEYCAQGEVIGVEKKSVYEPLGLTPVADSKVGIYDTTIDWNEPGVGTLASNFKSNGNHTLDVTYTTESGNEMVVRYFIINSCLKKDTEILIAEDDEEKKKKRRRKKKIQDITYDDDIVVWDFDKGEFTTAKPIWIKKPEVSYSYNLLKFSDGSELCTIDQHRIFNKEAGKFTYPMTDETPIGTTTFNAEGKEVKLVSKEVVEENIEYYNIITEYHLNLFANGILTSCRLNNIYPIENMKFVKQDKELLDIKQLEGIEEKYIKGLRLQEQIEDINRDNATKVGNNIKDYVMRLLGVAKEN